MSADNWAVCPKCNQQAIADLESAYGKVPEKEYLLLRENRSLREDYEIGIYEGDFQISYRAECSICGFNYSFEHSVDPLKT